MLRVKSIPIAFLVAWYAGLFYLPRLFACHAMAGDAGFRGRFRVMERKLSNTGSPVLHRWISEIPLPYLVGIMILVVARPI